MAPHLVQCVVTEKALVVVAVIVLSDHLLFGVTGALCFDGDIQKSLRHESRHHAFDHRKGLRLRDVEEGRLCEHSFELFGERADVAQIEQAEIGSGSGLARYLEKFLREIDAEHTKTAILKEPGLLP